MFKKLNKFLVLLLVLPCLFMLSACKGKDDKKKQQPEVVTYSINYILNGGMNSFDNPNTYTNQSQTIILANPSKNAYYTFAGWYTEETFQNKVTEIPAGSSGDKTFYAKWDLVEYTITYVMNGGTNSNSNPSNFNFESDTIVLENPTFDNFVFEGWYLDSGFNSRVYQIEKGSYGNKTLYAKWKNAVFSITYELYGGTNNELNPSNYNISSDKIILKDPTKIGYDFAGWFADKSYTISSSEIPTGSTENKIFHAKWTPIDYSITYVLDNGTNSLDNPNLYNIETPTIMLQEPSKTGYDFSGWFKDENKTQKITEIALGSIDNLTLYAKWTPKNYKVFLEYDGATSNNDTTSLDVVYLTEIGTLPSPEKDDFDFSGWWYNNVEITSATIFNYTENITLTAKWTSIIVPEKYTVTFNSNEGSSVEDYTEIEFGTKISKPADPTKSGYTFDAWYYNDKEWNFDTDAVTENITLDAHWDIIIYKITYYLDSGINNLSNPLEFTVETDTIVLADPEKEGFDFLGWYTTLDKTEEITQIEKGTTKDIYLYADWKEREVTKSTANISLVYGLPTQLSSLYTDSTEVASIGTRYELPNFNNLNIKNYFLGYYYYKDSQLITLEDNFYSVDNTDDVTIYANWNTENLLKYFYSDGLNISISGEYAVVSSYSGNASKIYIPEYYFSNGTDYLINKIGDGCFEDNFSILNIEFLNRASSIEIGENAFLNSTLENIDFRYISKIGVSAFENSKISKVESSEKFLSISSNAFKSCLNLTDINLTYSNPTFISIGESAFSGCTNLINIILSSSLSNIGNYAFENCTKITNVNFLEIVAPNTSLGSYVFKDCLGLQSIKLPSNITYSGTNLFLGCSNIKEVELTRSLSIKYGDKFINLFGTTSIEKVIISGDYFTVIPALYFSEMTSLTTLRMSDSVTLIESNAFVNCSALSDIYLSKGLDLDKFDITAFEGTYWYEQLDYVLVIDTTLVYIPTIETLTNIVIESGVTSISSKVAKSNTYITSLYIPKTVKVIESNAFSGCINLTNVEFETGSELETISSNAFYQCKRLEFINLYDCVNLKFIGSYAFSQAGYLLSNSYINGETGFELPNSLETIEDSVFVKAKINKLVANGAHFVTDENGILYEVNENGDKITIIYAPKTFSDIFFKVESSITKIRTLAFNECSSIKYLYVEGNVEFGKNSLNSSTLLLKSESTIITFESLNHTINSYALTKLPYEYECVKDGDSYTVTVIPPTSDEESGETETIKAGCYYINYEDRTILVRIVISGGVAKVYQTFDLTEYLSLN